MRQYILEADGKTPKVATDEEAREWYRKITADWTVKVVKQEPVGPYFVSTVFLGMDHNFMGYGPPVLWETMIFIDKDEGNLDFTGVDDYQTRYSSYEDALEGHAEAVKYAMELLLTKDGEKGNEDKDKSVLPEG